MRFSFLPLFACAALASGAFAAEPVDFAHDVLPVLKARCAKCHTDGTYKGELSLDTRKTLLASEAVVPGKSADSRLIERVTSDDPDVRMPPEGDPLTEKQIAALRAWIDQGIPWQEGFSFKQQQYVPPLAPRRPELPPARDGRTNPVDRILDDYYARHDVQPPPPVDDATFMRRVCLDLVGLPPRPEELRAFLADSAPDKRLRLVRELLADDRAYADHWLTFWNDLLRNDYAGTGYIDGGRKQITGWLYRSLLENKPYDQFVRELIHPRPESEGFIKGIKWRGRVNASQVREIQFAQNVSQVMLGINMKCASCHDSFIDHWKLKDAYGLAAIVSDRPLEIHRCDKPTGETARAKFLFPELGSIDPDAPRDQRLAQLAELMVDPENGRLTRTIVNRLWHRLFGRAIVHPVDVMSNEPFSENLIDYLAVHLSDNEYDLRRSLELMVTSQAYQSQAVSLEEPPGAKYVFRGPLPKRMTAEQFLDAVWMITGTGPNRPDAPVSLTGGGEADLGGKWIWSTREASDGVPAGEQITLRRRFELRQKPLAARAVITCDNAYTLFVNGRRLAADNDWSTVETVDLAQSLAEGENEVLIVAKNLGGAPNPAALYFEAQLELPGGKQETLASDDQWQWAAAAPDDEGSVSAKANEWKPAQPVSKQDFLGADVHSRIRAALGARTREDKYFVRAALVNADFLMRTLGRPNREQVVTTRPDELTTLQALELTNGGTLTDTLSRGAANLLREHPDATPEEMARRLYVSALSRPPTAEELAVARDIAGDPMTRQGLADLVWAIVMLPEFQLIR